MRMLCPSGELTSPVRRSRMFPLFENPGAGVADTDPAAELQLQTVLLPRDEDRHTRLTGDLGVTAGEPDGAALTLTCIPTDDRLETFEVDSVPRRLRLPSVRRDCRATLADPNTSPLARASPGRVRRGRWL